MNTGPHVIKYVRFKYKLDKKGAISFINEAFSNPKTKEAFEFQEWCKFDPFDDKNII